MAPRDSAPATSRPCSKRSSASKKRAGTSRRGAVDVVHSKGKVPRQAHVAIPEGTFEEEHGRETFFGRASHLYRTHPPTAWTKIEGKLRPRAFNLNEVKPGD